MTQHAVSVGQEPVCQDSVASGRIGSGDESRLQPAVKFLITDVPLNPEVLRCDQEPQGSCRLQLEQPCDGGAQIGQFLVEVSDQCGRCGTGNLVSPGLLRQGNTPRCESAPRGLALAA